MTSTLEKTESLALFDFDGTITNKDSLLEIAKFSRGQLAYLLGMLRLSPGLLAMRLGLIGNQPAKESFLTLFFGGSPLVEFNDTCRAFVSTRIPSLIRPGAIERILWHQNLGHRVCIVTASPVNWVEPWCSSLGLECIGTVLEIVDGRISGRIDGINCHGEEKVHRIRRQIDLNSFKDIYAYGDSSGDKPMLSLAHHPAYKPFRGPFETPTSPSR